MQQGAHWAALLLCLPCCARFSLCCTCYSSLFLSFISMSLPWGIRVSTCCISIIWAVLLPGAAHMSSTCMQIGPVCLPSAPLSTHARDRPGGPRLVP